jgi:hypothetical protein
MCPCRGAEVWFLKRAQIFVGDVWGAFQVGLVYNAIMKPKYFSVAGDKSLLIREYRAA